MGEPIFAGFTTPEQDDALLKSIRQVCFNQGQAANDNNHKVIRTRKGELKNNPFEVGSENYKAWNEGYGYRDMVNDG